jgi:succinoglycan biosynthesis protein ExoU
LVADNILFAASPLSAVPPRTPAPGRNWPIDLGTFARANIPRRGRSRREWGFLKPLMSRAFLDSAGLRYDEAIRFGEDYDLYCRALASGARFRLVAGCGYCAVISAGSLSTRQTTADLERFLAVDDRLLSGFDLAPSDRGAVEQHQQAVRRQFWLRRFLDSKRDLGLVRALRRSAASPDELLWVAVGVARDKIDMARAAFGDRPTAPPSRPLVLFEEPG